MGTAGAIIRVSTARQLDGTSPEKQLEKIKELAEIQRYTIASNHIWQVAEFGSLREREGFSQALRAGENGEITRVYVFNIDRLGRDLLEMLLFLRALDDIGLDCWGAEKGQPLRGDDFMLQIEGAVASKERHEIIKRTQDGMIRAIKAGKYSGGIVAYGYRVDPNTKQLEIDEEEAKVIRNIFRWCVEEQISCVVIAERLNALGVPTRYAKDKRKIRRKGKRAGEHTAGIWRAGRIRNMLVNSAYMGEWEWGKKSKKRRDRERIKGHCPAIVSPEIYHRARAILKSNQLMPSKKTRKYLLRGLIKCEHCGLTYSGTYSLIAGKGGKKKERRYYVCNGRSQWKKLGKEKCNSKGLNAEEIETVVWEEIKSFCKRPEIAIEQLQEQRQPVDDTVHERLLEVEDQIKELKHQEKNILKIAIESQEIDSNLLDEQVRDNKQAQETLLEYKRQLEVEQVQEKNLEDKLSDIAERLNKLGRRIDKASFEERRKAVQELVKGITVATNIVDDVMVPYVAITYRFNDPTEIDLSNLNAGVLNHTPARVATTEIIISTSRSSSNKPLSRI